jgi:hypothetical protein
VNPKLEETMQFIALVYQNVEKQQTRSKEEWAKIFAEYSILNKELKAEGHLLANYAVQPVSEAMTVRSRNDKLDLVGGPAFDTPDQLTAIYLYEAENIETAARMAGRMPAARWGSVEVRPLMVYKNTSEKTYQKA